MRFLTLFAAALPLVSSVPTDTQPSLNPPLQSAEKRGELSCGLVGYDLDNPSPFLVKASRCSVTNCASLCKNKPSCKSYSISNTKCSLYSAPVAGNFVADAESAYKFYDKDCTPCDSPDGFRLRLEDKAGALYGYVSNTFNEFGERTTTDDLASALRVRYKASSSKFKQLDLIHKNSAAFTDLTHLSGIVGFSNTNSNLGPGLYNYAYLGASSGTAPGSRPQSGIDNTFTRATGIPKDVESAIWSIKWRSHEVTAQWINLDSSLPTVYLVEIQGFLALTGDVDAMRNTFGPLTELKMYSERVD